MESKPSADTELLSIDRLNIADESIPTNLLEPNPWNETLRQDGEPPLHTPDPTALDPNITKGVAAFSTAETVTPLKEETPKEVLDEFDPLAIPEEIDARDAWANSDAHPPPPTQQNTLPAPDTPQEEMTTPAPSTATSPTFSSLAALARSFSIPSINRTRPTSIDIANPVPSPSTLSSFAQQQDEGSPRTATPRLEPQSSTASPAPSRNGDPPFDFQKFLDQMKTRSADPVSKYLKSFLSNFAKRVFTVNDQIKIINDFLVFIAKQMRDCDVWRNASDAEFENAMEGMEKLVMNQLYQFTFTPQVVNVTPRRQVTSDDLERDRVLSQRIALFGWIEEKHLDIPVSDGGKGFVMFAEQELLKINHYKAPRDKLICILNCCKVIFGLIRHMQKDGGADAFVPILIFVVLKANPDHLLSNVEFINRFRNPSKLQSEAGYYLSSLMGAVSFIETMDHTSLSNISQEEFEKNVESAISSLPSTEGNSPAIRSFDPPTAHRVSSSVSSPVSHTGEESAQPLSLPTPGQTLSDDAKRLLQKTGDTISKPLSAISRILNEALDNAEGKLIELSRDNSPPAVPTWSHPDQIRQYAGSNSSRSGSPGGVIPQTPITSDGYHAPLQTPYKPRVKRVPSPSYSGQPSSPGFSTEDTPSRSAPYTNRPLAISPSQPRMSSLLATESAHVSRTPTPSLDIPGMQAEIDIAHEQAAVAANDTLRQIFPAVDTEVVGWVLEANDGDLGKSIEALLEMVDG